MGNTSMYSICLKLNTMLIAKYKNPFQKKDNQSNNLKEHYTLPRLL